MAMETSTRDENSSQSANEVKIPLNDLAGHDHSRDENDSDNQEYDVPPHCESPTLKFTFPILSIIIYITHLSVDLVLAAEYLREQNILYFVFTLSFAIMPGLFVNLFLAFWTKQNTRQTCIGFLKFEPLRDFVRCFNFLCKSMKFEKESVNYKKNYYRMFKSRTNALKADTLETALKFCTQGILQFYIADEQSNQGGLHEIGLLQRTSIVVNLVHLFWTLGCNVLEQKIFLAVLGVFLYLADIISDLMLFAEYLWEEQYLYAILTLGFVLGASISITYESPRRKEEQPMNSLKNWLICVPIVMFNLEPVIPAIQSIRFRLKMNKDLENSSKCEHYNRKRRLNKGSAADLKFIETLFEAAPQLTLQVSLLLFSTLKGYEVNFRVALQLLSIVTSFIGFGAGTLSHYNAWLVDYGRDKMSKLATVLMFLWCFPVIVSRILAIGMMASISPLSMVIFIGVHWMISFLYWLYYYRRRAVLERIIFSIWDSIANIFIPDPIDRETIIAVTSSILGIENLCLVLYVIFFASFEGLSINESYKSNIRTFYHILSAISICSGVLGNIFMVLFVFVLKLHVSFDELENNSIIDA